MKNISPILVAFLSFTFLSFNSVAREANDGGVTLEELRWVDNGYLERQRAFVDDLGRGEFGSRLRGDKSDLRVLQRILDEGLINQTETQKQQALGVALGDVFVNELGLEWVVYLDAVGKSRATCVKGTTHCLFPITMISKRARLGVTPNVQELYDAAAGYLKPHLPKLPYSARK